MLFKSNCSIFMSCCTAKLSKYRKVTIFSVDLCFVEICALLIESSCDISCLGSWINFAIFISFQSELLFPSVFNSICRKFGLLSNFNLSEGIKVVFRSLVTFWCEYLKSDKIRKIKKAFRNYRTRYFVTDVFVYFV